MTQCSSLDSLPNEILEQIVSHLAFPHQLSSIAQLSTTWNSRVIQWTSSRLQEEVTSSITFISSYISPLTVPIPKDTLKEFLNLKDLHTWVVGVEKEAIKTIEKNSSLLELEKLSKIPEMETAPRLVQDIVSCAWSSFSLDGLTCDLYAKKVIKKLTCMPPGTECYNKALTLASESTRYAKLVIDSFASQGKLNEALLLFTSLPAIEKISTLASIAASIVLQGGVDSVSSISKKYLSIEAVSKEQKSLFPDVNIGPLSITPHSFSNYIKLCKIKTYHKMLLATIKKKDFAQCHKLLSDLLDDSDLLEFTKRDTTIFSAIHGIAQSIVNKAQDKGYKEEACKLLFDLRNSISLSYLHVFISRMAFAAAKEGDEAFLDLVLSYYSELLFANKQAFRLELPSLSESLKRVAQNSTSEENERTQKLFLKLELFLTKCNFN